MIEVWLAVIYFIVGAASACVAGFIIGGARERSKWEGGDGGIYDPVDFGDVTGVSNDYEGLGSPVTFGDITVEKIGEWGGVFSRVGAGSLEYVGGDHATASVDAKIRLNTGDKVELTVNGEPVHFHIKID